MKKLLTAKQIADTFQVKAATVRNWAYAGVLKSIRVGGVRRFPAEQVERILKGAEADCTNLTLTDANDS